VKFALSLLSLAAVAFTSGCTTLANRRDLYSPTEGTGPYSKRFDYYREYHEGIYGISHNNYHEIAHDEGIFGISNSDDRYREQHPDDVGLFGISRNDD
jgi:hypothetical protein